jgi:hypothetical protein
MQRISILGVCALLVAGFVWLLVNSNEPTVSLEDAESGAPSRARAEGEPRSAAGSANPLRSAGSAPARAPGAPTAPRQDDPASTPAAAGSSAPFARSPSGPDVVDDAPAAGGASPPPGVGGAARAERGPEPTPPAEPDPEVPGRGSADPEQCGAFSAAEIALRVEKALPRGSLPENQLAALREVEQKRLCDQARRALEFAN